MKTLSDFTKQYSLSKTLRFELRPVNPDGSRITDSDERKKRLMIIKDIIAEDKKRAEDYEALKEILNDLHRELIEDVLKSKDIIDTTDIEKAYKTYLTVKQDPVKNTKLEKDFKDQQKKMRSAIANKFKENDLFNMLFKPKDLFKIDSGSNESPISLKVRVLYDERNNDEIEEVVRVVKSFDKFTTYLTGFNENRKNMYSNDAESTAIAYRIINENMLLYFDNCMYFEKLAQNFPDLIKQFDCEKCNGLFTPDKFNAYLSQSGIDEYNETLGKKREKDHETDKGINQLINEYKQGLIKKYEDKTEAKREQRKLYTMTMLYKQILSPRDDDFAAGFKFENGEEALEAINTFYFSLKSDNLLERLKCILKDTFSNDDQYYLDTLYINNISKSLSEISNAIYGEWSLIVDARRYCVDVLVDAKGKALSAGKIEKENKRLEDSKILSLGELSNWLREYNEALDKENQIDPCAICNYFTKIDSLLGNIEAKYSRFKKVYTAKELPRNPKKDSDGYHKVETTKEFLDSVMDLLHYLKPLYIKTGLPENSLSEFYSEFNLIYAELEKLITIYNKTRNFVTEKPYSVDKIKLNFSNVTLLDGWDVNKENANTSVILLKDNKYYLGIMNKNSNNLFNYIVEEEDSENKIKLKTELSDQILDDGGIDYYEKMIYALLPQPVKMLPKVFFSAKRQDYFAPSQRILDIRRDKLYSGENDCNAKNEWIDFMQNCCLKHSDWMKRYHFTFKRPDEYNSYFEFCDDVAQQGYKLSFDKIKSSYIEEKVNSGELYLFEIYNKDFSEYSKGRKNLHTLYWQGIFNPDNLKDIVVALNGGAEVFYRECSIHRDERVIHRKGDKMQFRNNSKRNKERSFKYDIIKDKRYSEDKLFFHCPVTLNFNKGDIYNKNHNLNVLNYLRNNPEVNIIGIDRGERHLLYLTLIDQNGKILRQETLNVITNTYNGEDFITNYHGKLDSIEKARDAERKSWSQIENIKEMKAGYLSQVVHKIATMMIDFNAIVVLEDLNFGFKRGRFAVEKQVYQKFEKALIDKLNYLVFKDKNFYLEAGHFLNAYQLTAPFESFTKLGKQSGFLFYVNANNTSKIDPVTGFVRLFNTRYHNITTSQQFWKAFKTIAYNKDNDYFEFVFDYKQKEFKARLSKELNKTEWVVCSYGNERYSYDNSRKLTVCTDVTASLKELFEQYNVSFNSGACLKEQITALSSKDFFYNLHFLFGLLLNLRYSCNSGAKYIDIYGNEKIMSSEQDIDFILSPVADKNGVFYDSRDYAVKDTPELPIDADANGAYNIARKGLILLNRLAEVEGEIVIGKGGFDNNISNDEWFNYAQHDWC